MKKVDASDVTIISVTYNSAHCLPALSDALKTVKNVVIVDNASDDDIEAQLQIALPNATLIRNAKNLGFGAANNQALATVTTPHALLLLSLIHI